MLSPPSVRHRGRESVSLGGFQNFNLLKMGHFRKYGVEDESESYRNVIDDLSRDITAGILEERGELPSIVEIAKNWPVL